MTCPTLNELTQQFATKRAFDAHRKVGFFLFPLYPRCQRASRRRPNQAKPRHKLAYTAATNR